MSEYDDMVVPAGKWLDLCGRHKIVYDALQAIMNDTHCVEHMPQDKKARAFAALEKAQISGLGNGELT